MTSTVHPFLLYLTMQADTFGTAVCIACIMVSLATILCIIISDGYSTFDTSATVFRIRALKFFVLALILGIVYALLPSTETLKAILQI